MLNKSYFCPNCGFKSNNTQGLVPTKGGCSSCGKSGFKCPRCGMGIKIARTASTSNFSPLKEQTFQPFKPISRKEKPFVSKPVYERSIKIPKINRP